MGIVYVKKKTVHVMLRAWNLSLIETTITANIECLQNHAALKRIYMYM